MSDSSGGGYLLAYQRSLASDALASGSLDPRLLPFIDMLELRPLLKLSFILRPGGARKHPSMATGIEALIQGNGGRYTIALSHRSVELANLIIGGDLYDFQSLADAPEAIDAEHGAMVLSFPSSPAPAAPRTAAPCHAPAPPAPAAAADPRSESFWDWLMRDTGVTG